MLILFSICFLFSFVFDFFSFLSSQQLISSFFYSFVLMYFFLYQSRIENLTYSNKRKFKFQSDLKKEKNAKFMAIDWLIDWLFLCMILSYINIKISPFWNFQFFFSSSILYLFSPFSLISKSMNENENAVSRTKTAIRNERKNNERRLRRKFYVAVL